MRRLAVAFVLDGFAVKTMRQPPKISFSELPAPTHWIAAVSAAEEISRKVRKVRKEMEDGKEATSGSGITQFAEGEQKRLKCAISIDATENLECDGLPSLSYLTACRQVNAEASQNQRTWKARPPHWIAAVSAAEEI